MGTLFAFCMVSIGVMILRKTQPEARRPFRCPAVQIVAPLAVLTCGFLIYQLPPNTFLFFGCWFAIGMVVYFSFSSQNTRLVEDANGEVDNAIPSELAVPEVD